MDTDDDVFPVNPNRRLVQERQKLSQATTFARSCHLSSFAHRPFPDGGAAGQRNREARGARPLNAGRCQGRSGNLSLRPM